MAELSNPTRWPALNWRLIGRVVLSFWVWFYMPNMDRVLRAEEPKPVKIVRVYPKLSLGATQFKVTVWVEPHEGNRELCLVWGQDLYEQSCRQLYGTQSPRAFHYPLSNSKMLKYVGTNFVAVVLKRSDGSTYTVKETVEIRGME